MRNSEARQHKSFTPSITDILSRQNILIYHRRGPAKLSTQFMALSMGKKVNTYTSTLQGCILKMQGGCELGLEKQMFSFRRQREVEKLAKSSHPYQAMKSPEILSCTQDERKTPSILHLLNFGAKCIILYNYKLLQTEDFFCFKVMHELIQLQLSIISTVESFLKLIRQLVWRTVIYQRSCHLSVICQSSEPFLRIHMTVFYHPL